MTLSAAFLGTATTETRQCSVHFEPAERLVGTGKFVQNGYVNFIRDTLLDGTVTDTVVVSVGGYFKPPREGGWTWKDAQVTGDLRARVIAAARGVLQ